MCRYDVEPKAVLKFFYEISKIPRGSGNMKGITQFCLSFAKKRGLESFQDDAGNVIIYKCGTPGYENSQPLILQGHLDMVCEKREGCQKDMDLEGIDVICDGNYLFANGTTLGGDNGIAIAYILALLDDKGTISHPPLEALFTVDEEIGLGGASDLDCTKLKGKRLINLDSEEEGVLTVSCAGGVSACLAIPITCEPVPASKCAKKLVVKGLLSGHSGIDIGKSRKNAAILLAKFLFELKKQFEIRLFNFKSGGRLNVIPPTASVTICFDVSQKERFYQFLSKFNDELKNACALTEPNAEISSVSVDIPHACLNKSSGNLLISMIMLVPNGVSEISEEIPFLVKTSSNLGNVCVVHNSLNLEFMIRSNADISKAEAIQKLQCLADCFGGKLEISDDYPAWEYRSLSPLRECMTSTYEAMYGKKMEIRAIHAGLECGIFAKKIPDIDMVSIGPNMKNVHTPDEKLEIKSVQKCWQYLLQVLKNLK